MSRDNVNSKEKPKKDINWNVLIEDLEREISTCQNRIKTLRKSLFFFKKQADSGIPFPLEKDGRHKELS
jgi:hypothetical protein